MNRQFLGYAAVAIVVAILPFVGVYPIFAMKVMCYALFACAFNLLLGFTGLLSFGHAAFLGSAAYAAGHALKVWGFPTEIGLLFGVAVAALLGLAMGALAIRRSGIYFAMITLALAQMVFFFFLQAHFTGGEDGLQGVPRGTLLGLVDLSEDLNLYYVVMGVFALGFFIIWRTVHSPFGQVLQALRENEPRAVSLGYDVDRFKLLAFVLSAAIAGLAGATKTLVFVSATLSDATWQMSGLVILMTLIGGLGTLTGPVLGAFIVVLLENKVGDFGQMLARATGMDWFLRLGESVTIVIGLIFVICVLAFRRGIVGEIGAFMQRRRAARRRAGAGRESQRRGRAAQRALGRMLHGLEERHVFQVRIVQQFIQAVGRPRGNVVFQEERQPFGRAALQQAAADRFVQRLRMADAVSHRGKARIRRQFGPAQQGEQALPLRVRIGNQADVAFAGLQGPMVAAEDALVAARGRGRGRPAENVVGQVLDQIERRHGLEHGHFHLLPLPAGRARHQGRRDRAGQIDAAELVGEQHGHESRFSVHARMQARHPAHSLDHVVVGRALRVAAVLVKAQRHGIDQPRMARGQAVVVDAQPPRGRGAHVVHEDIGRGQQRVQARHVAGGLEVQHHAALASVQVEEKGTHLRIARAADHAHRIALRRLDLDHLGAHIREQLGRHRPEHEVAGVDDAHAGQRTCHIRSSWLNVARVSVRAACISMG